MNYIQQYHKKVKNGDIIVCDKMHLQIERVEKLLKNPNYYYDDDAGTRPTRFIETFCRHYKGEFAGKPVILELWQKYIMAVAYGIKNVHTNKRVTKQLAIIVARKNGKTTWMGGLSLYHLTKDGESFPEVYSVATKKDQAALLYQDVQKMVSYSPHLSKVIKKRKSDLEYLGDVGGILKPLSSDSNTLDGLNVSLGIFDEVHAYKDQNIIDVVESSQGAREQPLNVFITTAGTTRDSVYDDLYNDYDNLLTGITTDDTIQPFIFELDDIDEVDNEDMWIKANPNIDVSVSREWLREQVTKLKNSDIKAVGIYTKNFNIPQNPRAVFFTAEMCEVNPFNEGDLRGTYGFMGIDLSYTKDLSVIAYHTRTKDDKILSKRWYLIPEEIRVTKNIEDKKDYSIYSHVRYIKGSTINEAVVIQEIQKIIKEEGIIILKMGIDPYRAGVVIEHYRYAVDKDYVKAINNKYKSALTPTTYQLRDELERKNYYFNDRLLTHHLGGCVAKIDKYEEIILEKLKSTIRIDGAYASIYALKAEDYYKKEF